MHYTVPFEEDERDPSVWFLDHNYLENMAAMFKKVNSELPCSLKHSYYGAGACVAPGNSIRTLL